APDTALALSLTKRVPEILLGLPGLLAWQTLLLRERRRTGSAPEPTPGPHPLVRLANRVGGPLSPFIRFDADELLGQAARRPRLPDFGSDTFREPLDVLLRAYEREACLTVVGRLAVRMNALRLLEQRLWFEEYRKRHPDIAAQQVRAPLFIISLS